MTTRDDALDLIADDYAPAQILLELLNRLVPGFVEVREKVRSRYELLWSGYVAAWDAADDFFDRSVDPQLLVPAAEKAITGNLRLRELFESYAQELSEIAKPLGSPNNFVELMLVEDVKIAIPGTKTWQRIRSETRAPTFGMPGTLSGELNEWIRAGMAMSAGLDSPMDLHDPVIYGKAYRVNERRSKRFVLRVEKENPLDVIGVWVLSKVMKLPHSEIGQIIHRSEDTLKHYVTRANKSLGVQTVRGRPRSGSAPLEVWRAITSRQ